MKRIFLLLLLSIVGGGQSQSFASEVKEDRVYVSEDASGCKTSLQLSGLVIVIRPEGYCENYSGPTVETINDLLSTAARDGLDLKTKEYIFFKSSNNLAWNEKSIDCYLKSNAFKSHPGKFTDGQHGLVTNLNSCEIFSDMRLALSKYDISISLEEIQKLGIVDVSRLNKNNRQNVSSTWLGRHKGISGIVPIGGDLGFKISPNTGKNKE